MLSENLNTIANCFWGLGVGHALTVRPCDVKIVAHRGARRESGMVENTLKSFEACRKTGVWGIELDVRLTRDGVPVVRHDPDCRRDFGRGDIHISRTDFNDLRSAIPDIPLLTEVIERFGGEFHLMIEVKEDPATRPGLAQKISETLNPLEAERDYHLLSLTPEFLEHFYDIPKSAFIDVSWFNVSETLRKNMAMGHGGMAGSFALITERKICALRDAGKRIGSGFIETRGVFNREIQRGMDWLFTDYPLRTVGFCNRPPQNQELLSKSLS